MGSRRDTSQRTTFVVLLAASICLTSFAVWCTFLVREVRGLRGDVEARVVWMQRIHARRSATTAAARRDATLQLRDHAPQIRAALLDAPHLQPDIATLVTVSPLPSTSAVDTAADRVVPALRRQTGQLSRALGEHWDALYWLVGASLFFAVSALGLGLVILRINAKRARSDVERLEAQLLRADRLAALGTLAATVAHEINNPLAFVVANLELIRERLIINNPDIEHGVDSDIDDWLRDASAGVERVATIVADLRTFSHPHDADTEAVADVHEALAAAIRIAEGEARGRAKIHHAFASGRYRVKASDAQLCQVFLNLLVNALQAIEAGEPETNTIDIRTRADSGAETPQVVIEIQDSGEGIDPSLAERLFDPFVTTKAVGQGTGLGLYVCHGIIDRAGGSIEIRPVDAGGTCAVVTLPLALEAQTALPAPARPPTGPQHAAPRRLLIIDDEADLAAALSQSLRDFETTVANSGPQGLAALQASEFDAILCDLMMPGLTGAEVYEQAIEGRPELRGAFVFMTGGALTARTQQFLARADVAMLHKPFSRQELLDVLTQAGRAPVSLDACADGSTDCASAC